MKPAQMKFRDTEAIAICDMIARLVNDCWSIDICESVDSVIDYDDNSITYYPYLVAAGSYGMEYHTATGYSLLEALESLWAQLPK